jgi:hypothetical protein
MDSEEYQYRPRDWEEAARSGSPTGREDLCLKATNGLASFTQPWPCGLLAWNQYMAPNENLDRNPVT